MTPIVLRSTSHKVLCLLGTAVCVLFVVGNLVVAARSDRPAPQVVVAIVFVLLGLLSLRFAFASIVVDRANGTLVVRNPLRTYAIPFGDIDRMGLRDSWVPNTYRNNRQLLAVYRRHGSRVTMIGGCAVGRDAVTRMRDQLAAVVR